MNNKSFSEILIDSIKHRYGCLISSARIARDIDLISDGEVSVSSEAVRKWIRGKSVPRGNSLFALELLLGDYFIQKRLHKNSGNRFSRYIDEMSLNELIEVGRLIDFRIQHSQPNVSRSRSINEIRGDIK